MKLTFQVHDDDQGILFYVEKKKMKKEEARTSQRHATTALLCVLKLVSCVCMQVLDKYLKYRSQDNRPNP